MAITTHCVALQHLLMRRYRAGAAAAGGRRPASGSGVVGAQATRSAAENQACDEAVCGNRMWRNGAGKR